MERIDALGKLAFEKKDSDAFLVTNEPNMFYLSNATGAACLLIPKKGQSTLYVYELNYEQVKAETKGFKLETLKRGDKIAEKINPQLKALGIKKLAVDSMSYETYRLFSKTMRGRIRLKMMGNTVQELRKVKDEEELRRMRKAGQITVAGMKAAYETIKPGVTEIDVAAEIEYAMRKSKSYGTAFESIVASGMRSAFPHGGCADRKIRKGDLVVVDIGGTFEGYRSDMTRTFAAGKSSEKQEKLYEVVKISQERAFHAIRSKASGRVVDQEARKIIEKAGYGENFNHGLGHGVGIEVHEPPVLAPNSRDRLVHGNVVTNEPGIYFPGYGGVRIEDTVVVRQRSGEKFTDGFYGLETRN